MWSPTLVDYWPSGHCSFCRKERRELKEKISNSTQASHTWFVTVAGVGVHRSPVWFLSTLVVQAKTCFLALFLLKSRRLLWPPSPLFNIQQQHCVHTAKHGAGLSSIIMQQWTFLSHELWWMAKGTPRHGFAPAQQGQALLNNSAVCSCSHRNLMSLFYCGDVCQENPTGCTGGKWGSQRGKARGRGGKTWQKPEDLWCHFQLLHKSSHFPFLVQWLATMWPKTGLTPLKLTSPMEMKQQTHLFWCMAGWHIINITSHNHRGCQSIRNFFRQH